HGRMPAEVWVVPGTRPGAAPDRALPSLEPGGIRPTLSAPRRGPPHIQALKATRPAYRDDREGSQRTSRLSSPTAPGKARPSLSLQVTPTRIRLPRGKRPRLPFLCILPRLLKT